jgi:hypothetical protein
LEKIYAVVKAVLASLPSTSQETFLAVFVTAVRNSLKAKFGSVSVTVLNILIQTRRRAGLSAFKRHMSGRKK